MKIINFSHKQGFWASKWSDSHQIGSIPLPNWYLGQHRGDFWNFDFFLFSGDFKANFGPFWAKMTKKSNFISQKSAKNEKIKNPLCVALDINWVKVQTQFGENLIIHWLKKPVGVKKMEFLLFLIYRDFLYIVSEFRENTLHVWDRQISTVRSWEAVEPILKSRNIGL